MTTQDLEKKIEELTNENAELRREVERQTKFQESNWKYYIEEKEVTKRLQEKLNVISKITEF